MGDLQKIFELHSNQNPGFKIIIDPFYFLLGGIVTVGVGSAVDEISGSEISEENPVRVEEDQELSNSTLQSFATPIRCATRFLGGGYSYCLVDTMMLQVFGNRIPAFNGALIGMLEASGSRPRVFYGCTIGSALFCYIAHLCFLWYRAKFPPK